jgi:hypothetical protein
VIGLAWSAGLIPWSTADGMIRPYPSASKARWDDELAMIPEPECPPEGAVLQTTPAYAGSLVVTCEDVRALDRCLSYIPRAGPAELDCQLGKLHDAAAESA